MPTRYSPDHCVAANRRQRFSRLLLPLIGWMPLVLLASCATSWPIGRTVPQRPPAAAPAAPAAPVTPPPQPAPAPAPQAVTPPVELPPPVAAPVPADKDALLQAWAEQQNRLYRVAAPLLIRNTGLCGNHVRNVLGFTAKNRYSYPEDFSAAAASALHLNDRLQVMNVLPGAGAEAAGVQPGDLLAVVEIEPLPTGPNAERAAAALIGSEMQGRTSLNVTVLRGDDRVTLNVPLTPACAFAIELGNADFANSYTDGRRIVVTRGMLQFVRSDEELAYVLAHALAHGLLTQGPRPESAAAIDRLHTLAETPVGADGITGIMPFSAEQEAAADELALNLLAGAGYRIDDMPGFWQQLSGPYVNQVADAYAAQHPITERRLQTMARLIPAIRDRQVENKP